MRTIATLILLAMAGWAQAAPTQTASVRLAWENPSTNVDGTQLTDLAGVKIYYGTTSSNYTQTIDVPGGQAGATGTVLVTNLALSTRFYFAATAYNTAGYESDYSTELVWTSPRKPAKVQTLIGFS